MKSVVLLVVVIIVLGGLVTVGVYNYTHNNAKKQNGSHAYLGAIYYGQAKSIDYISANISFNGSSNLNNIIYYVVLSIWDNNDSYDQLGVASLNGKFFSTYSYTVTASNGSIKYIFSNQWFPIKTGNHTISMRIFAGYVSFVFDNYSIVKFTGGTHFLERSFNNFNGSRYSGLTVYEEMYGFNDKFPNFSYNFSDIQGGSVDNLSPITDWQFFNHSLSYSYSPYVFMSGNVVNIYNTSPLTLHGIAEVSSPIYLKVADITLNISKNQEYSLGLMQGTYVISMEYQNRSVFNTTTISLDRDMWYNVTRL